MIQSGWKPFLPRRSICERIHIDKVIACIPSMGVQIGTESGILLPKNTKYGKSRPFRAIFVAARILVQLLWSGSSHARVGKVPRANSARKLSRAPSVFFPQTPSSSSRSPKFNSSSSCCIATHKPCQPLDHAVRNACADPAVFQFANSGMQVAGCIVCDIVVLSFVLR